MTTHLSAGLRLSYRAADCICRLAPRVANSEKPSTPPAVDDPFSALPQTAKGHEEPAKDDVPLMSTQMPPFAGKHLYGLQLQVAEVKPPTLFVLSNAHRSIRVW